jgi:hypothetical protein
MGVVLANYSILVRPDLTQVFWARMRSGGFISEAVELIDTSRRTGRRILVDAGGVRPRRGRDLKGRCLTFTQREEIAIRRAQGQSLRQIGADPVDEPAPGCRDQPRAGVIRLPLRRPLFVGREQRLLNGVFA